MIELGLQRISRLLAETPLPWRAIHVAGTNGKGSVCAHVSSLLERFNRSKWREQQRLPIIRHGRFTSPHIIDRWDCITLNQSPVSFSTFREVEQRVLARNKHERIEASEFELLTATAFEVFTQEKLDVAVVEVGMGGRLDATNVLGQRDVDCPAGITLEEFRPLPLASVITKIGLDHQAFLGDTLEAIAREKAGIVKPGVPVFYDESNEKSVVNKIQQIAAEKGVVASPSSSKEIQQDFASQRGAISDPNSLPYHAFINASLAQKATLTAVDAFYHLSTSKDTTCTNPLSSFPAELLSSTLPGRQQTLSITSIIPTRRIPILLDGAHNEQSAEALSAVLLRNRSSASQIQDATSATPSKFSVTWMLATSDSKPPHSILKPLIEPGDRVFAVEFGPADGMPWIRATACDVIEGAAREVVAEKVGETDSLSAVEVHRCGRDILRALRAASEVAGEGPLVVAGSLYLVGEVLKLVREAEKSSGEGARRIS